VKNLLGTRSKSALCNRQKELCVVQTCCIIEMKAKEINFDQLVVIIYIYCKILVCVESHAKLFFKL